MIEYCTVICSRTQAAASAARSELSTGFISPPTRAPTIARPASSAVITLIRLRPDGFVATALARVRHSSVAADRRGCAPASSVPNNAVATPDSAQSLSARYRAARCPAPPRTLMGIDQSFRVIGEAGAGLLAGEHCWTLRPFGISRARPCPGWLVRVARQALMGCRATSTDPLGRRWEARRLNPAVDQLEGGAR